MTLNYQAGGGGDAGAEGIKTGAEEGEATHKSSCGKTSVQEPTPRAERGDRSPAPRGMQLGRALTQQHLATGEGHIHGVDARLQDLTACPAPRQTQ